MDTTNPSVSPITTIRIGYWEKEVCSSMELMAKFDFPERKLVWEIVGGDEPKRKRKMEILFSLITALEAKLHPHQPGKVLRIELSSPPSFYEEITPGKCQEIDDFTQGEAKLHRIHYASFPPRALDEHLKKLLELDENLLKLSRIPFPTLQGSSPYFYLPVNYPRMDDRVRMMQQLNDRVRMTQQLNDQVRMRTRMMQQINYQVRMMQQINYPRMDDQVRMMQQINDQVRMIQLNDGVMQQINDQVRMTQQINDQVRMIQLNDGVMRMQQINDQVRMMQQINNPSMDDRVRIMQQINDRMRMIQLNDEVMMEQNEINASVNDDSHD